MSKSLVAMSAMVSVLVSSLVVGCASTGNTTMTTPNPTVAVSQIAVNPVKVNLKQKFDNANFYNQAELESYLTTCLTKDLQAKGKTISTDSNAPHLNLTVDYKRVYSGEAFGMSKAIGGAELGYQYQIAQNGKVLQQKTKTKLNANEGLVTVFTQGLLNTSKESENRFLEAICKDVSKEIK